MLILLKKRGGLAVNPDHVTSICFVDMGGRRYLEVRMIDGEAHMIENTAGDLDGDNIYAVHQQLLEAQ